MANKNAQLAYTAVAPATKITPPSAGPVMTAACMPAELNAMARGNMSGGTSIGVSACCAGIWNARATPSMTDTPSSNSREAQPLDAPQPCVAATRIKATLACVTRHAATMRPRCKRSATCPATSVSSSAGKN